MVSQLDATMICGLGGAPRYVESPIITIILFSTLNCRGDMFLVPFIVADAIFFKKIL